RAGVFLFGRLGRKQLVAGGATDFPCPHVGGELQSAVAMGAVDEWHDWSLVQVQRNRESTNVVPGPAMPRQPIFAVRRASSGALPRYGPAGSSFWMCSLDAAGCASGVALPSPSGLVATTGTGTGWCRPA